MDTVNHKNEKNTYWYKFVIDECVLCGHSKEYKIRVYDKPKPENVEDRYEYHQYACGYHFL